MSNDDRLFQFRLRESPRVLWRLWRLELGDAAGVALTIVELLVLGWWDVASSAVKAPVVPPSDPLGGRQLEVLEGPPGSAPMDEFCLV